MLTSPLPLPPFPLPLVLMPHSLPGPLPLTSFAQTLLRPAPQIAQFTVVLYSISRFGRKYMHGVPKLSLAVIQAINSHT